MISLVDQDGTEFAKGNPNYNSGEINSIKGLKTTQIKKALGYIRCKEIIARKNIHIIESKKR